MGEIVATRLVPVMYPGFTARVSTSAECKPGVGSMNHFGEDVFLSSEMGAAALRGMQGDNPNHIDAYHVAGCLKHYFAYGAPYNGLDRSRPD